MQSGCGDNKDKQELIDLRRRELEEWLERSFSDDLIKLGSYKAFQEIVEAMNDLVAMMLKDSGLLPADDYANIEKAGQRKLLPLPLMKPMQEMTGLRNRIVHEYNGLNDALAKESILRLLEDIVQFQEWVDLWLKKQTT